MHAVAQLLPGPRATQQWLRSDGGNPSQWTCDAAHSNSDYVPGSHLGNDIWAAQGTPVVATVSGTFRLVGWSDYASGSGF